jgi:hypothetical protein
LYIPLVFPSSALLFSTVLLVSAEKLLYCLSIIFIRKSPLSLKRSRSKSRWCWGKTFFCSHLKNVTSKSTQYKTHIRHSKALQLIKSKKRLLLLNISELNTYGKEMVIFPLLANTQKRDPLSRILLLLPSFL